MNPNYGKYTAEEQQQAGAFLDVCGYIGDQDWGVPSHKVTSQEQLYEEARAERILAALREYDRKNGFEELDCTPPTEAETIRAIYQTYKEQPALQAAYSATEYIRIRLRMIKQNTTK